MHIKPLYVIISDQTQRDDNNKYEIPTRRSDNAQVNETEYQDIRVGVYENVS